MGGFGSGRNWGKRTVDDQRSLDVRRLARDGCLKPGMAVTWHWLQRGELVSSINFFVQSDRVWMTYKHQERGGEWQNMCYPITLDRTACHLGGERVWWRCPSRHCGRRVAVLYAGAVFACRHCLKLAYPSQRETFDDRACRRADTLRARLKWEPGILNGDGIKPKGMHWRTFQRLQARHDALVRVAWAGMGAHLGRVRLRFSTIKRR